MNQVLQELNCGMSRQNHTLYGSVYCQLDSKCFEWPSIWVKGMFDSLELAAASLKSEEFIMIVFCFCSQTEQDVWQRQPMLGSFSESALWNC